MRRILVIVFLLNVVNEENVTAQVPETLAYLQSVVANKAQFVGQPFSVLRDSLKIQIKYFSPFGSISYDITKETSTSFSFFFPQTINDLYLTYPKLDIFWRPPYLDNQQAHSLYNQYHGGWTQIVATHYNSGIIADIKIRE